MGTLRIDTKEAMIYGILVVVTLIYLEWSTDLKSIRSDIAEIRREVAPREWEQDFEADDPDEDLDEED